MSHSDEPQPPPIESSHGASGPAETQLELERARLVELFFSGPLPPPNILEQYERLVPGAADRILRLWEDEVAHRRELELKRSDIERDQIANECKLRAKGQWLGFVLALCVLGVALVAIVRGHPLAGLASVVIALGSVVAAYLYSDRKRPREERPRRAEVARKPLGELATEPGGSPDRETTQSKDGGGQ